MGKRPKLQKSKMCSDRSYLWRYLYYANSIHLVQLRPIWFLTILTQSHHPCNKKTISLMSSLWSHVPISTVQVAFYGCIFVELRVILDLLLLHVLILFLENSFDISHPYADWIWNQDSIWNSTFNINILEICKADILIKYLLIYTCLILM